MHSAKQIVPLRQRRTIVFALFCDAFIGGVSLAHGEGFYKKTTKNVDNSIVFFCINGLGHSFDRS